MWKTDFKTLTEYLDENIGAGYLMSCLNTEIIYEDTCCFMEAEKNAVYIPKLKLELHNGTFWQKADDGEFYPDWAFTSINTIAHSMKEYLYYEQGSMYSALHNYLHASGFEHTDIDNLTAIFKPTCEPEPFKYSFRKTFCL